MSAVPAVIDESQMAVGVSATSLLLDNQSMVQIMKLAEMMAGSSVTVPKHLQGNVGDCAAVIMQSMQWRMNPYAVAQKTHISKSGQLGYEAQLVNAVVTTLAPITGRPDYEFIGDWSKILGKVEEKTGQGGGKYYAAAWKPEDEAGLGVIVRCTLRGEIAPRSVQVMMSQAYPRFSTQWATDPQQQICYLAVRKWARRVTPDVLLGVYTPEELVDITTPPAERDMGPAEVVGQAPAATRTDSVKERLRGAAKQEPAKPASALDEAKAAIAACKTLAELESVKSGESFGRWAELSDADMKVAKGEYTARKKALSARPATTIDSDTGEIVGGEPFLLAQFQEGAKQAAARGRASLLEYAAGNVARLPDDQRGEADVEVQRLLRGLNEEA